MKTIKRVFSLLFFFVAAMSVQTMQAQTDGDVNKYNAVADDWNFNPETGNLYVNYDFEGTDTDDYPWHSVRDKVKNVNIGSNVTKIGYMMFADCVNLLSIAIPEGVTNIGNFAFYNCSSLTSVTIPASVTDIQMNAFLRCVDLSSTIVNRKNVRYRDVEDRAIVAGDTLAVGCGLAARLWHRLLRAVAGYGKLHADPHRPCRRYLQGDGAGLRALRRLGRVQCLGREGLRDQHRHAECQW